MSDTMPLSVACRCGTTKLRLNAATNITMCHNCDACQDSECHADEAKRRRRRTRADYRYHLAWEQIKRQIYTPVARWPDGGQIT